MKKQTLLTLYLVLVAGVLSAQVPVGYYNTAAGKGGRSLQIALFEIIDNHQSQSYSGLWNCFYTTDVRDDGFVWDIYSDIPGGTPPYLYTFGNDQCGNYSSEGDCYNREHSMPKSWFNDASPMYTDLFHIYPTDGAVNGRRSNFPYGEVNNSSWTSRNGSKLGSCSTPGYSGTVFEPIDEYKGDLARTYLYMCTRYFDEKLDYENGSYMLEGSQFKPWALALLLSWHEADPVSQKEIDRNKAIYNIQRNRNPFIDYPELAGKIFGADSVNVFTPNGVKAYEEKCFTVAPNPAKEILVIRSDNEYVDHVLIVDMLGREMFSEQIETQGDFSIDLSAFSPGLYFIQISNKKGKETHKIVKI
ncbi:endonuclease [Bacteroidales bacterium OttesenSCG-928-B11]|nr:endonuclease [Bacteroidales bacterium OttesenSCG-928-B11]MDL2326987.1 endonuclease [Bacteroidales bacterium OttesenSCG-928-A14]